jgi:hypothetical protein
MCSKCYKGECAWLHTILSIWWSLWSGCFSIVASSAHICIHTEPTCTRTLAHPLPSCAATSPVAELLPSHVARFHAQSVGRYPGVCFQLPSLLCWLVPTSPVGLDPACLTTGCLSGIQLSGIGRRALQKLTLTRPFWTKPLQLR